MNPELTQVSFPVADYDLHTTLASGQSFGWRRQGDAWTGVIHGRWVRLRSAPSAIQAATVQAPADWRWLREYLQIDAPLDRIIATFPQDPWMQTAVRACPGLRLLRQDPWECLAGFILSSTKRITQIEQITARLCACYGDPVGVPLGVEPAYTFPAAARLAACSEAQLRACKMGFRAPYLLAAARHVAEGRLDWKQMASSPIGEAREALVAIPGVGRKIADCVLLFTGLFPQAFPVDVWILRTLQEQYFKNQPVSPKKILEFTEHYFGPWAGYAQQYVFHHARMQGAAKRGDRDKALP